MRLPLGTTNSLYEPLSAEELLTLERVSAEYLASRLDAGGQVFRDGPSIQRVMPGVPLWFLNTASGLASDDPDQVDRCVARFEAAGTSPRFEITPPGHSAVLATRLAQHGLLQTGFVAVLAARVADVQTEPAPHVAIRRVDAESFASFHRINQRGYDAPPSHASSFAWWLEQPGWSLWIGAVDRVDLGIAILYERDGVGFLATVATDPDGRGLGVQAALIRHRARFAHQRGATLISATAAWDGPSRRNLERAGLRMICTKAVWTRP